jgi:hypothetical protein
MLRSHVSNGKVAIEIIERDKVAENIMAVKVLI